MNATREEVEFHARTYHSFLMSLRWVLMGIAGSLATIVMIFARAGVIPALIGGSIMFAIVAYVSKYVFLNPHEHEVEDMAKRIGR
jgi:hypothetical protein